MISIHIIQILKLQIKLTLKLSHFAKSAVLYIVPRATFMHGCVRTRFIQVKHSLSMNAQVFFKVFLFPSAPNRSNCSAKLFALKFIAMATEHKTAVCWKHARVSLICIQHDGAERRSVWNSQNKICLHSLNFVLVFYRGKLEYCNYFITSFIRYSMRSQYSM